MKKRLWTIAVILITVMAMGLLLTACGGGDKPAAGTPSAPKSFTAGTTTSTSVSVSWLAPDNAGDSAVTKYEVQKNGDSGWTDNGMALSHEFTGLTPNTSYTFKVRAVNGEGAGATAEVIKKTDNEQQQQSGTPSAPQNLMAIPDYQEVTLAWGAPSSNGGSAITGYEVSKDNGATWEPANAVLGSILGHQFEGLTNGTAYTFQVRAVNANGKGAVATKTATPVHNTYDYKLPTNVKYTGETKMVTGPVTATTTDTVIKIGNDYYKANAMLVGGSSIITEEKCLKHNAGTWTEYKRSPGSAWQATGKTYDATSVIKAIEKDYFAIMVSVSDYTDIQTLPSEGTVVIAGVSTTKHTMTTSMGNIVFYYDAASKLFFKNENTMGGNVTFEVKTWDTTVTDFGTVTLPA